MIEHTKERWLDQRVTASRAGSIALAIAQGELSEHSEYAPSKDRVFVARDDYERLAIMRAADFQGLDVKDVRHALQQGSKAHDNELLARRLQIWDQLSQSSNVAFGFMVIGRVLGYAAETYSDHCRGTNRQPSLTDLESILLHPKSFSNTVHLLAKMPKAKNKHWERAANLIDALYAPKSESNPLIIQQGDRGDHLAFSMKVRGNALGGVLGGSNEVETAGECPAAKVYLPKVWRQMVNDCLTIPELFPAEINRLNSMAEAR